MYINLENYVKIVFYLSIYKRYIRDLDDYIFKESCNCNKIEILEWLCSICDKYDYEIDKIGKIKCIIETQK